MTTSPPSDNRLEAYLRLTWRTGEGHQSRLYRIADPAWRQVHSYLAGIPSAHVRIVYDHAATL
jgi:hypothetical protein